MKTVWEIWIKDNADKPTYIKTYPHLIQCWTWAILKGYVSRGRHWYFKDKRVEFREVEDKTNE